MLQSHKCAWSMVFLLLMAHGCNSGRLPTAPVEGKIAYRGKPLEFGGVAFVPKSGPAAHGTIQSNGEFCLSTYGKGDGAVLGEHQIQISCYQNQKPGAPETNPPGSPGELYIPAKYTNYGSSGLRFEVGARNEPVVLELRD